MIKFRAGKHVRQPAGFRGSSQSRKSSITPMRAQISKVLDTDGLKLDSVRQLNDLARAELLQSPTLANFVAHSVFRSVSDQWDDSQGVPTAQYDQFQQVLLPRPKIWLQSDPSFTDVAEMAKVIASLHACL